MKLVNWIRFRMSHRPCRRATGKHDSPRSQRKEGHAPPGQRPDFARRRHQPIVRHSVLPLVGLLLCLGATSRATAASGDAFDKANSEFAQQHFAEAAHFYEAVIAQKGYSAPVLFDLANAYAREGKWGLAILNYRRARLLAPRDPDIAANFRFAREKAGLPASPLPWYAPGAQFFSPKGWACVGSLCLLVACASLLASRLYPARRGALCWISLVGLLAVVAAVCADLYWWQEGRRAVVLENNAPLRVAPAMAAEASVSLPEGDCVRIQEVNGDFALVMDAAGRRGWLSKAQISQVVTKHPNSKEVL